MMDCYQCFYGAREIISFIMIGDVLKKIASDTWLLLTLIRLEFLTVAFFLEGKRGRTIQFDPPIMSQELIQYHYNFL